MPNPAAPGSIGEGRRAADPSAARGILRPARPVRRGHRRDRAAAPARDARRARPPRWPAGSCVAGAIAGALYGLLLKLPAADVARLADRGYGLADRISTALEWAGRPDRTPLIDALVTDAEAHVQRLEGRRIIARRFPREAKLVPLPLAAGLLLSISPPIPLPQGSLPNFSVSREDDEDKPKDRAGEIETSERAKPVKRDPVQRTDVLEKNFDAPRGRGESDPARRPVRDLQGHVARRQDARLQLLPEEGRRAHPDAGAARPPARSPAGLHAATEQGRLPEGQGAQGRARPEQGVAGEAPRASERDGAPRAQGRPEQLERRRVGRHGGARGRSDRQGDGGDGARAVQAALDGRARAATARVCAAGARTTGRAGSAGASAAPASRAARARKAISPRAKASCPGGARARARRATPPIVSAPIRSTSAWRASRARGASRVSTPT